MTIQEKEQYENDLRKFAAARNGEFGLTKVYLYYHGDKIQYGVEPFNYYVPGAIWFSDKRIAEEAVQYFGEEEIKKYMREVIIDGEKFELPDRKVERILGLAQSAYEKKRADEFYTINSLYKVVQWNDEHKPEDEMTFYLENYFITESAARDRLRMRKIEAELREYAMNNNENFKSEKIGLFYDSDEEEIGYGKTETTTLMPGVIWFSSEEIARAAVEKVGEDRVKDYLRWEFK